MYLYTFLAVDVHAMGDSRIQGLATPTHFVALCGTKSSTQFPVQKETKGDTITKNQCVVCKSCAENSAKGWFHMVDCQLQGAAKLTRLHQSSRVLQLQGRSCFSVWWFCSCRSCRSARGSSLRGRTVCVRARWYLINPDTICSVGHRCFQKQSWKLKSRRSFMFHGTDLE